ncbi:MAG TPA: AraC family transcriptional regulator [Candidatus Dormibacteraeota bacterium]|nr:AraC family transcriptional regulator [Candidatus Dormibacteraeota bacterium]
MPPKLEIPSAEPVLASGRRTETSEIYQASVIKIIRHMKQHLQDPLDLERLAQIASISKFHFVRVFDEVTGTTPHHFVACLRMQRAKELLLETADPITDICLEVGYTSLGSFSKSFTFLVGMSPVAFRGIPKRLDSMRFGQIVWRFLSARKKEPGPQLTGILEGPSRPRGFTFVGTFTRGVPQGIPYSGTVVLGRGKFQVKRPDMDEFHLMAVLVPFSAKLKQMVTHLPVGLVASLRVQNYRPSQAPPRLRLRPLSPIDPPIVLALPSLPPLASIGDWS